MFIINGNYGNDTVALIQWCREAALENVVVVSVDTGWAAPDWSDRVDAGEAFARQCGFEVKRLMSPMPFTDLVKDRQCFPSPKFHWCANFLKALPLLEWLDEVDLSCEATVIIAKRRTEAKANAQMPEKIEDSEYYGGRTVWYPLHAHDLAGRDALIDRSGLEKLHSRSLECFTCIYQQRHDFDSMSSEAIARLKALESSIDQPMYKPEDFGGARGIEAVVEWVRAHSEEVSDQALGDGERDVYYSGCGSEFGCGL
ncbi:MAG: hypothetical protein ACE365_03785 [Gammaproteobacteria bacterium]